MVSRTLKPFVEEGHFFFLDVLGLLSVMFFEPTWLHVFHLPSAKPLMVGACPVLSPLDHCWPLVAELAQKGEKTGAVDVVDSGGGMSL